MKNILKVIGLSLSAACSCSADKCRNCNENDVAYSTGLCQLCTEMHICKNCGKFETACVTATGICLECCQHECSQCGIIDSSLVHYEPSSGTLCEQCRKAKQDPFGMQLKL